MPFGTPEEIQAFEMRQRAALAQQLTAQGISGAPIQHWAQGLGRLASALAGRNLQGQLRDEGRNLEDKAQLRTAEMLRLFDPTTGQVQPPASTGGQTPGMATPPAGAEMGGGISAPPITVPRAPTGTTFNSPGMFGEGQPPAAPTTPGMNIRPPSGMFGGGAPIGNPVAEPPLMLQGAPAGGGQPRPAQAGGLAPDIEQVVRETAQRHGVPYELARAVVMRESTGRHIDPRTGQPIQGAAGERGLMQLMPETARGLGVDPNDLRQNVDGGIRYLRQNLDRFGGNIPAAVAAYNAGPGHRGVAALAQTGDPSGLPPSTREYVAYIQQQLGGGAPAGGGQPMAGGGGSDVPRGTPPQGAPGAGNPMGFTPEQQRALMAALLDPRQREQAMAIMQFRQAMQPPQRAPVSVAPGAALVDPMTGRVVHQQPREQQDPRVFTGPNGQQFLVAPNGRVTPVAGGAGGQFQGTGMEAQAYNILTAPNADTSSPQYAAAWRHLTQERFAMVPGPDGTLIPSMVPPTPMPPNIRPPTHMQQGAGPAAPQQAAVAPGQPPVGGTAPAGLPPPPQVAQAPVPPPPGVPSPVGPPVGLQQTPPATPPVAAPRQVGETRYQPMPAAAQTQLQTVAGFLNQTRALLDSLRPGTGGAVSDAAGDARNWAGRNIPAGVLGVTPETGQRAQWWQQYAALQNFERHELFGAALTASEQASWRQQAIGPGMTDAQIRANLTRRAELMQSAIQRAANGLRASGHSPAAITGFLGFNPFGEQSGATPQGNQAPQGQGGAPPGQRLRFNPATGAIE